MSDELTNRLGFGCAKLLRLRSSRERQKLLYAAYDCGIRHFDTARMYGLGAAEAEVGKFLRSIHDPVVITTKFGIPIANSFKRMLAQIIGRRLISWFPSWGNAGKRRAKSLYLNKNFSVEAAEKSLHESLRSLQRDFVNALLLHEPTSSDYISPLLLDKLGNLVEKGIIGSFGVSGGIQDTIFSDNVRPIHWPILQFSFDCSMEIPIGVDTRSEIITFSPVSNIIERLSDNRLEELRSAILEHFLIDICERDSFTALLIRASLEAIPKSKVLFSVSKPTQVKRVAEKVCTLQFGTADLSTLRRSLRLGSIGP